MKNYLWSSHFHVQTELGTLEHSLSSPSKKRILNLLMKLQIIKQGNLGLAQTSKKKKNCVMNLQQQEELPTSNIY